MSPGPGSRHIEHGSAVGVQGARADVGDRQDRALADLALQIQIPDFVVLDLKVVIQVVAAHRTQAGGGQRILDLEAGRSRGIGIHRLGHEERQILREARDDAVGRLVGINAEASAQDGVRMSRQSPGKPASRSKAQRPGCQQAVVPPRRGGGHVGNGQKRQQRVRRRGNLPRGVAGDDESAAGNRCVDRRHLIVGVRHVLVVFITKPDDRVSDCARPASCPEYKNAPNWCWRPWRRVPGPPARWSDRPAGSRRKRSHRPTRPPMT